MTKDELQEDLARAVDPARLLIGAGLTPDPWQADLLRGAWRRALLNVHRQGGKSVCAAALGLHAALYEPGSLVLLVSPSLRQSQELFQKVKRLYRANRRPQPVEKESALRIRFASGSRIIALPGTEQTIRGFSAVSLLVLDEAARVEDDLYRSVRPMLAVSGGRMVAMSTPFGKRGFFFEEWTGGDGWERVKVPATECDRISEAFLETERTALGDWWFQQEYLCVFGETTHSLFSHAMLEAAIDETVAPLFAGPRPSTLRADVEPLFEDYEL